VGEKYHGAASFACAAGAFLVCSVILVPGEVLKCRMQVSRTVVRTSILHVPYCAVLYRIVPYSTRTAHPSC